MLQRWAFVFCFLMIQLGFSQDDDFIETDRPDQTEGTNFLARKDFQMENGILFSESILENELSLRYGLSSGTELRASLVSSKNISDMLSLSVKQSLLKGNRWIPDVALYGYINYTPDKRWFTDVLIAFSNSISSKFALDYHFGTVSGFERLHNSVLLNYQPTPRWMFFIEHALLYGWSSSPEHSTDLGLGYDITRNCQIDFIFGNRDFSFDNQSLFFGIGFGYRIKD